MSQIAILAIAGFVMASCSSRSEGKQQIAKVKTLEAVSYGDSETLKFPGRVVADEKFYPAFKVAGRIASVAVTEGQRVRVGQNLAALDSRDYRIALDAAEAEYSAIKAEADRVIALYGENATTQSNYDKAVYGLKQITAKLDHARNQLSETTLTAPVSGVVKNIYRRQGDVVGAGTPILEIIDDSNRLVEIKIPAADYLRRERFESYSCRMDLYPDHIFALTPYSISDVANGNQLYTVKLRFASLEQHVPPVGVSPTVEIMMRPTAAGSGSSVREWLVPTTALREGSGRLTVLIVRPDSILADADVQVKRLNSDGMAVVTSATDLSGKPIVGAGVGKLRPGDKVQPLAQPSDTNVGNLL